MPRKSKENRSREIRSDRTLKRQRVLANTQPRLPIEHAPKGAHPPKAAPPARSRRNNRECAVFFAGGPDGDFNILTQSREEFHKASNGKTTGTVPHQQRDLRLLHSEDLGDLDLCQAAILEDGVDLQGELRLEQLLLWIGKAKVSKDVPTAFGYAGNSTCAFLVLLFILILPFSIIALGLGEPSFNQIDFPGRRGNPFGGLLLKHVQHIDGILKTHGVDSPPGIAVM